MEDWGAGLAVEELKRNGQGKSPDTWPRRAAPCSLVSKNPSSLQIGDTFLVLSAVSLLSPPKCPKGHPHFSNPAW